MSIRLGKDGYSVLDEFTERTQRELADRGEVFLRDTQPPPDEIAWVASHLRGRWRVLELGCGLGPWCPVATAVGCDYVGVDAVPERIGYADARYGGSPGDGVVFYVGDARKWRTTEQFDTVLCVTILQHLTVLDAVAVLETALFHLRPGGLIIALESGISDCTEEEAEALYALESTPCHVIPKPLHLLQLPGLVWETDGVHDHWLIRRV